MVNATTNVEDIEVVRNQNNHEALNLLQTSRTFPKIEEIEKTLIGSKIITMCEYALETGEPVQFISDPGVGKTSFCTSYFRNKGLNVLLLHMPTIDIDRLSVSIPVDVKDEATGHVSKVLSPIMMEQLKNADVVIFDEPRRAKPVVRNAMMEILQEKSHGGVPLKEGVIFILCNNNASEGGVNTSGTDLAQESRYITVELKPADLPWQAALAATYKDADLSKVFKRYSELEYTYPGSTKFLSPRTLDHVLWNILNDLPGVYGLPLMAGPREKIMASIKGAKAPKDVTDEIIKGFCSDLGVPFRTPAPGDALRAIQVSTRLGKNIIIQGPPGVGKTSYVVAELQRLGIKNHYWSMQNVNPDEHIVPFPRDGKLDLMISSVLKPLDGSEYTLIADEYYRAKPSVLNMMLEVTQGATLGGQAIPIRNVIAMTNPRIVAGERQEVGKPDRAQADRFYCSVMVTEEDIPANDYLVKKYGEVAEIFLAWWKNDLEEAERTKITKRTLEKMIRLWTIFRDMEHVALARPYMQDRYVPVSLVELKRRLKSEDKLTFASVDADKEKYYSDLILRDANGQTTNPDVHLKVNQILNDAEMTTLEKYEETAVELLARLDHVYRPGFLKSVPDKKLLNFRSAIIRKAAARCRELQASGELYTPGNAK